MRIPRIYLPLPMTIDSEISLDDNAMRHVVKVLRLKPGHRLILFNGNGGEYQAQLVTVEKRLARVHILSYTETNSESALFTHLALGISKGERMDFAIQKAVELGVTTITPLYTEHCVIQLSRQREEKRTNHWLSVITSACEQSGRNCLPKLNSPCDFIDLLQVDHPETCLILEPEAELAMKDVNLSSSRVLLCVGPEGGFSQNELALAQRKDFISVKLGARILRTETAAMTSLAVAQSLWGDI